ncbi:hypothetical protein T12_9947 [Trichinella patagoniensis]|uniref:Uncharacterized protein n=1 Tax=Trichinella patagoniensis TaxID=990121 RepID=A0A0V0XDQ8_9BILA|nr:hypothetical protein T12_9947 [Trichinella patagoniensis]
MIIFILRITLIICAGGWVPAKTASNEKRSKVVLSLWNKGQPL